MLIYQMFELVNITIKLTASLLNESDFIVT